MLAGPRVSEDSPVSTSHSAKGALILQICAVTSGFTWIIEIQTRILMPVWQVYYTLNHLPVQYLDTFNFERKVLGISIQKLA